MAWSCRKDLRTKESSLPRVPVTHDQGRNCSQSHTGSRVSENSAVTSAPHPEGPLSLPPTCPCVNQLLKTAQNSTCPSAGAATGTLFVILLERKSSGSQCGERMNTGCYLQLPALRLTCLEQAVMQGLHVSCKTFVVQWGLLYQLQSGPQGIPGEQQETHSGEIKGIRDSEVGSLPGPTGSSYCRRHSGCFLAWLQSLHTSLSPRGPRDSYIHQPLLNSFLNLPKS